MTSCLTLASQMSRDVAQLGGEEKTKRDVNVLNAVVEPADGV